MVDQAKERAPREGAWGLFLSPLKLGRCGRPWIRAPAPALLPVALDLARQVVGDLVDRCDRRGAGLLRPERDALEVKGRHGDLRLARPRRLVLGELDLELGLR